MNKRVCIIRSDDGCSDSRVQKTIYTLSKEYDVFLLGWDRSQSGEEYTRKVKIYDKEYNYVLIPEAARFGLGIKSILFPMLRFWRRLYKYLIDNSESYDYIHSVNFDTIVPAFRAKKKLNKKIVYDVFDYYADTYNAPKLIKSIIRRMENHYISKVDLTIICSEERIQQINGSHPKELIVVENTPLEMPVESDFKIKSGGKIKIAYGGMLVFDRFLKEQAEVISSRDDVEWHVAGYGTLEDYIKDIASKKENIHYYGKLPHEDILALEMQCDIMTVLQDPNVANNKYSAPNKYYEALKLGKPVIIGNNGSLYKQIEQNRLGEVIDIINEPVKNSFNEALDRLIERKDEWARIENEAKRLYSEKFPWSKSEKILLDSYSKLS